MPYNRKQTVFCPIKGCNYTSRKWIGFVDKLSLKTSCSSTMCPKHRTKLLNEYELKIKN